MGIAEPVVPPGNSAPGRKLFIGGRGGGAEGIMGGGGIMPLIIPVGGIIMNGGGNGPMEPWGAGTGMLGRIGAIAGIGMPQP